MKVVHIQWIDSCTEVGWEDAKDDEGFEVSHTVGFVVSETAHYTVIANSYDPPSNQWNGRIAIPNCSIVKVKVLCRIKTK